MKKLPKILGLLTLLFSILVGFSSIANEEVHATPPVTASVTLHKKMMDELPDPLLQNTGEVDSRFDVYENYSDGIEFKVYDVTTSFYNARAGGSTVDQALATVTANPTAGTLTATQTTGPNGLAGFNLPKKSGGKDAVYVFVETDKAGVTKAANMALAFPVYKMNTDGSYTNKELNEIHLYPKNIVSKGDLEVTKKGTADDALLNGAEFIIQSNQTNRYLSGVANGFFTWSDNIANAKKFYTGRTYGIGTNAFTDVAGSDGLLRIAGLIPGSYKLIETDAPDNVAIIDEYQNIDFTIVANATTPTTVTVWNDTIKVDKEHVGLIADYDIGDLIPYTASVNIPWGIGDKLSNDNYKHPEFIITDVPVAGLKFNNDLAVTINGVNFAINPDWLDTSGNGFVLTIPASALETFAGEDLDLAYNMYLDGTAVPDLDYNNTIKVETDLLEDDDETEDVYTGGKRFVKIDANFTGDNNKLAGAKFVVKRVSDGKFMVVGANNAITWVNTQAGATEIVSNANGIVNIMGLAYGDYQLIETEAPEDYVLNTTPIPFTVASGTYGVPGQLVNPAEVVNVRKGRLPLTGGPGIMGVVGVGIALVLTTGGYYFKRRDEE